MDGSKRCWVLEEIWGELQLTHPTNGHRAPTVHLSLFKTVAWPISCLHPGSPLAGI